LRWRGDLTGYRAGERVDLDDVVHRFTGVTVENIEMPGLGRDGDGVDRLALSLELDEGWRRRIVPVPEVVFEHLIVPLQLAGASIDRDETIGEQVVAETVRAVEVGCRGACRCKQQGALFVQGHAAPHIRAAGFL
jgi:hypothetical protein